jgi:hypothetical protein
LSPLKSAHITLLNFFPAVLQKHAASIHQVLVGFPHFAKKPLSLRMHWSKNWACFAIKPIFKLAKGNFEAC